jgi:hypothetical protein
LRWRASLERRTDGFRIESIHLRTEGYDVDSPLFALGIAERDDHRRVLGIALAFEPKKVADSQSFGAVGQLDRKIHVANRIRVRWDRSIPPATAPAPLSLVLGTSLSLLPIARIANPAASRVTEVSVRWHRDGQARAASFLEASLAVPVASRRVEVAV